MIEFRALFLDFGVWSICRIEKLELVDFTDEKPKFFNFWLKTIKFLLIVLLSSEKIYTFVRVFFIVLD